MPAAEKAPFVVVFRCVQFNSISFNSTGILRFQTRKAGPKSGESD